MEERTGRVFVLGDIHGAARALEQCLTRSKFTDADTLIFLGDAVDRWPESKQTVERLLSFKNLTQLLGNHDEWFLKHIKTGWRENLWTRQGGEATLKSYSGGIPDSHKEYFKSAKPYFELDNKLFVHGGFNIDRGARETPVDDLLWDRSVWQWATDAWTMQNDNARLDGYKEIYIGHTSTSMFSDEPINGGNVWCMDQGAGHEGKLTIMDIETKEFWQSDLVLELYAMEDY